MTVRLGLSWCGLLLAVMAVEAGEKSPVAESSPAVSRGELLNIELIPQSAPQPVPANNAEVPARTLPEPEVASTPAVLYVRVGEDGFARFPPTDRTLPFAGLELPVIEAMLTAHLALHGHSTTRAQVTRHMPGPCLVTVIGLVNKPGVYSLPADATIQDAIRAAGGLTGAPEPTPDPVFSFLGSPSSVNITLPPVPTLPHAGGRAQVAVHEVQARLEHQSLTLSAMNSGRQTVVVSSKDFGSARVCIDGIVLHIEVRQRPPAGETDDLFKPL